METDVRHDGTVIAYASRLKLCNKCGSELRTCTDKLHDMILYIRIGRPCYAYRHPFSPAHVEMGYYMEYALHIISRKSMFPVIAKIALIV